MESFVEEALMSLANETSSCSYYSSQEYLAVGILHTVFGAISFLATLFVIGLIVLFKKYRFFVQRLVLYISLAAMLFVLVDAIRNVDYFPQNEATERYCMAIGFMSQYAHWAMLMAMCMLTLDILLRLRLDTPDKNEATKQFEFFYIAVIVFVPLALNWIPFVFGAYGKAGDWCWIRDTHGPPNCTTWYTGVVLQFTLWWGPFVFLSLSLVVSYVAIIIKLQVEKRRWQGQYNPEEQIIRKNLRKEVRSLVWFPIIFIIFVLFPLINRLQNAITNKPILVLWILHAVIAPLQGGFIALAYALDPETRKRLNWRDLSGACRNFFRAEQGTVREYSAVVATEAIPSPYERLNKPESIHKYGSGTGTE